MFETCLFVVFCFVVVVVVFDDDVDDDVVVDDGVVVDDVDDDDSVVSWNGFIVSIIGNIYWIVRSDIWFSGKY